MPKKKMPRRQQLWRREQADEQHLSWYTTGYRLLQNVKAVTTVLSLLVCARQRVLRHKMRIFAMVVLSKPSEQSTCPVIDNWVYVKGGG